MLYLLFANFFFKSFQQKTLRDYINEYKEDSDLYSQFLSNIYLKYFFLEQENSELASLIKEELIIEVGQKFFQKKDLKTEYDFYPIESEELAIQQGAFYEKQNKKKAIDFYKNYFFLQPLSSKALERLVNIVDDKKDFIFYIKILLSRGEEESKIDVSKDLVSMGYCFLAIEEFERSISSEAQELKNYCLKKIKVF